MISIFNAKSGKLLRNVASLGGENMRGRASVECPADWERMRWDTDARRWVADDAAAAEVDGRRIDDAYRCEFGEGAKREAHHRKAIEARLYHHLGAAAAPMLTAEAEATGVPIDDLVAAVAAKDDEWIAREVGRRNAKMKGKRNG